jgi:hypothetical protein
MVAGQKERQKEREREREREREEKKTFLLSSSSLIASSSLRINKLGFEDGIIICVLG